MTQGQKEKKIGGGAQIFIAAFGTFLPQKKTFSPPPPKKMESVPDGKNHGNAYIVTFSKPIPFKTIL